MDHPRPGPGDRQVLAVDLAHHLDAAPVHGNRLAYALLPVRYAPDHIILLTGPDVPGIALLVLDEGQEPQVNLVQVLAHHPVQPALAGLHGLGVRLSNACYGGPPRGYPERYRLGSRLV